MRHSYTSLTHHINRIHTNDIQPNPSTHVESLQSSIGSLQWDAHSFQLRLLSWVVLQPWISFVGAMVWREKVLVLLLQNSSPRRTGRLAGTFRSMSKFVAPKLSGRPAKLVRGGILAFQELRAGGRGSLFWVGQRQLNLAGDREFVYSMASRCV